MSYSLPNSNLQVSEDHNKLRKRIDVMGRKHMLRKATDNKSSQNDYPQPEMQRSRKFTLSKQEDGCSNNNIKGKLLLKNKDKNSDNVDSAKSNEFPFKCQSQRLCLRRNELLGSILNPVCLSEELSHKKIWPDPHYERPTWESFKWKSPKLHSVDEVESLTQESSKCVMDYVRSSKELYDMIMNCECSKRPLPTVEKNRVRVDFPHQEDSNDVVWAQEQNDSRNSMMTEKIKFDDGVGFANRNDQTQGLLLNQQSSNGQERNSESGNESVMMIDLVSQSSKDSNSQTDIVPLEISDSLQNENRFLKSTESSFNFLSSQCDLGNSQSHLPLSTMAETLPGPLDQLAAVDNNGVSKYYANLFKVEKSSEWNEYCSSNLMLLKGDENMVANAKFSEGKVVLHSIKSDSVENQGSWDKDETITLYADNHAMIMVDEIGEETRQNLKQLSPKSSRSSSSSHSSYSCPRGCCSSSSDSSVQLLSSSSENDTRPCSMNASCSLHSITGADLDLHRALEETRKTSNELIVSTLVLHSMLSGRSQKDVVDELLKEC
ncbi:hypothetical protein LSTR_LSTR010574 [Laodelphax striatellus]|uniref:Uncharacterized protein n=1 Tax=Laodelphax striatellus TaxID=195883 RepID=A0A482XIH3_LAOST|nr:hypothetical protein LSTR_LSTR010574 [Laodelphax striatellus]